MMAASEYIRLVFFNTCFSFTQAEAVVEHVEAAIGMTDSIGDKAAEIFAAQFYSAIGFGLSVKRAFEQAKGALMMKGIPEEDTPELYVREGLNANDIIVVNPNQRDTSTQDERDSFNSVNLSGNISGVQIQQGTSNSVQYQIEKKSSRT